MDRQGRNRHRWPRPPSRGVNDLGREQSGFTLPEVLVSALIIVIASVGAIAAFNVIIQSVQGTEIRADQSRRIDSDISEISRLAEIYTSCQLAAGAVPAGDPDAYCTDGGNPVDAGSSFYYFPEITDASDPTTWTDAEAFATACQSASAGSHITANFIAAINGLAAPGGDVVRQNAIRVDGTDPTNHLVRIVWVDPTNANRVLRTIEVVPLVSTACP